MSEPLQNLTLGFDPSECEIVLDGLTKDYGNGRGIFDISLRIPKGKTVGYCGTNGAGKTTTLRHIMGFLKPDKGNVLVHNTNPWTSQFSSFRNHIGYCPGEINFPLVENGTEFLKLQAEMLGLNDMEKANRYINMLQLDPTASLRRMSKGMKQKTALVACFMHSPELILLDEPTTGLDPLMREAFLEILEEAKSSGATILMSNHMFDELDISCDYVAFIDAGHITDVVDMDAIHNRGFREYRLSFFDMDSYNEFKQSYPKVSRSEDRLLTLVVRVDMDDTQAFLTLLRRFYLKALTEIPYSLERYFLQKHGGFADEK